MKMRIGFVLSFALAAPGGAANWRLFAHGSDGTTVSADLDSFVRQGDIATLWIRYDFSRVKAEKDREMVTREQVNCVTTGTASLGWVRRNGAGKVTSSWDLPDGASSTFSLMPPDSLGAAIARFACPKPQ